MKKTEKIILLIAVIIYLLAFVDFGAVEFVYDFFFNLTNIVLCFMYLLGGYFLFKLPKKYMLLSVFSGIAFGLLFISNIYGLPIEHNNITKFFPIPNLILLFTLLVIFIIFKIKSKDFSTFKLLFLRSLIIGIITSFLSYMPISSKLYRTVMYGLNNGNENIQYNLKAHDYIWDFEKYYKRGDCNNAIKSVEKGLESGMKWLDKDYDYFNNQINNFIENSDFSDQAKKDFRYSIGWLTNDYDFVRIQGIMTKLFEAYCCKADNEFKIRNYQEAIKDFEKALIYLDISETEYDYWKQQRAYAYEDLAISYGKTGDFEKADLLFSTVLEHYEKTENKQEISKGILLRNYSKLYKDYQENESAVFLLKEALQIFEDNSEDKDYFVNTYLVREQLILNYIFLYNFEQAYFYLKQDFEKYDVKVFDNPQNAEMVYHKLLLFESMIKYFQESYTESLKILKENKHYIKSGEVNQSILNVTHYTYLGYNYLVVSEFDKVQEAVEKGLNYEVDATMKANLYSLSGNVNSIKSEYKKAKNDYQKALDIYDKTSDIENKKIDVYISLAELELELSDFEKTKYYLNLANQENESFDFVPRNAVFLNSVAYVNYGLGNYKIADSIYNGVIESNKKYGKENSVSSANSYNGSGLVKFSQKKYQEAEELFKKSITVYQKHFNEENYSLGIVYLNYANLLVETNQLEKAKLYLSKSENVFKKYFDDSHDSFGDLYLAFGDFYKKKKEISVSMEYYQKALKIYSDKFDENHHKVKLVKQKL